MQPWLDTLLYPLRSGKHPKVPYYLRGLLRDLTPGAIPRARRDALIEAGLARYGHDILNERVSYYNKLSGPTPLAPDAPPLSSQRLPRKGGVYYFDTREYTRYFPQSLRWRHLPGDVTHVPDEPTIVKSRPIAGDNANSVLLNLNKIRHFLFVNDTIPFRHKRPVAVFRGKVRLKPKRIALFNRHFDNPLCDLGDTSVSSSGPDAWKTAKMTIRDQLAYQFILAVEGNDVASNLKWILSSNSIAVMPRPEYETWFMEGRLVPNIHYVEIAPDYADLDEKIRYYARHPEAAETILQNAHAYVAAFTDPVRERVISLLVLKKYFALT